MKLSRLLLISAVLVSLTSCDDLFEPALENNQDISEMYKDPTFARGILDNAYLALPYSTSPYTDVATDDAVTNENSGDYFNHKKMATGSWAANMNPVSQWDGRYHAIQYCNLMLENCDKVEWSYSSEILNQMYCDNYKGNAYALRGLHMMYLLRAHAGMVDGQLMGVPIHLSSEDSKSDFNLPRNTFKECYDQIMSDFDEALKYLPEQYTDVNEDQVPAKYAQKGATNAEYNRAFGTNHRGKIDGRIISAFKAQLAILAASPAYASAGVASYEDAAKYAANCRCSTSCLSLNSFILFPNNIYLLLFEFDLIDRFCYKARRISTDFCEFRRIIPCHPSNFDEIDRFNEIYFSNQFRPSVHIKSSFFIVFNKSPKLRSFCSSVLFCGSTSLRYSYMLSRLSLSSPALLRYCRTI